MNGCFDSEDKNVSPLVSKIQEIERRMSNIEITINDAFSPLIKALIKELKKEEINVIQ